MDTIRTDSNKNGLTNVNILDSKDWRITGSATLEFPDVTLVIIIIILGIYYMYAISPKSNEHIACYKHTTNYRYIVAKHCYSYRTLTKHCKKKPTHSSNSTADKGLWQIQRGGGGCRVAGRYDTLLEIVRKLRWFGQAIWQTPSCRVKLRGKITRKASNAVVGRCKGMDRVEL